MPWAIFGASLALYVGLPSRNWTYADDSLRWAHALTLSGDLVNVHHLFFNGLRLLYHRLNEIPGVRIDPVRLLSIYCGVYGSVGLVFLHALLRLAGLGRVAVLAVLVCAFTAGYWSYAIVGDVYVPATACLVAAVYWLWRTIWAEVHAFRLGLLAVVSLVLMLLHHQAHFVFTAGLVPGVLVVRGAGHRQRVRTLLVLGLAGAVIFSVYLAAHARYGGGQPLVRFLSGYAADFRVRPDQEKITAGSVMAAGAGELRALISTNALFTSARITRAIQGRFPYRGIYPWRFLVRNLSGPPAALLLLSLVVAVLAGGVLLIRGLWTGVQERGFLAAVLIAAACQAVFFMWWEAISDEFWIWSTPIAAFTLAAGAASFGRRGRTWLGITAGGLLVSSWLGSIGLFADARNDIDAVNAEFHSRLTARDCLLGFDEIQIANRVALERERTPFSYFNVYDRLYAWTARDSARMLQLIEQARARGGRTFVSPYVLRPPLSYLALTRLANPTVDAQWRSVVAALSRLDSTRVVWITARGSVPGYFLDDTGAASESHPGSVGPRGGE